MIILGWVLAIVALVLLAVGAGFAVAAVVGSARRRH